MCALLSLNVKTYENDDTLTNFKSFIEGHIFVRLSLDHTCI